jgi:hypothetical protein
VSVSWDDGANWIPMNEGLTAFQVTRLTNDADHLYAGTLGNGGVFRRAISSIVGVQEVADQGSHMSVFPVPTRDRVQVQWPGHVPVHYRIRSISGAMLATGPLIGHAITLEHLAAGTYVLEVNDARGERRVARLVKE